MFVQAVYSNTYPNKYKRVFFYFSRAPLLSQFLEQCPGLSSDQMRRAFHMTGETTTSESKRVREREKGRNFTRKLLQFAIFFFAMSNANSTTDITLLSSQFHHYTIMLSYKGFDSSQLWFFHHSNIYALVEASRYSIDTLNVPRTHLNSNWWRLSFF